jgi:tetratricopeptide (TPR) repeat protein
MREPKREPRAWFAERLDELLRLAGPPRLDDVARSASWLVSSRARAAGKAPKRLVDKRRISAWRTGENVPAEPTVLAAVVTVLIDAVRQRKVSTRTVTEGLLDQRVWEQWRVAAVQASRSCEPSASFAPPSPRRMLVVEADLLLQLGVHRAAEASPGRLSVAGDAALPVYVPRDHDRRLWDALDPGNTANRLVVLVGKSTTGKTRSAAEMARRRMGNWDLFAPTDVCVLLRWIEEGIRPRTLLWLNELRDFLTGANGPAVAVALRGILAGEHRIVVIGTLWPGDWQDYTDPRKSAPTVRELLGRALRVDVPSQFSAAEWDRASEQRTLAIAVQSCSANRRLAQFLAATPDLLRRYADADSYSKALLTAAMDARRLGYHSLLPSALLERGAVGYINDRCRVDPPHDWYVNALRYATAEVKGAVAPLTALRTKPGIGPADGFQLADSLEEHARSARSQAIVPPEMWDALVAAAEDPDDLERLGLAAQSRCYYRYVHLVCRPATAHGRHLARYLIVRNLEDQDRVEEAHALRVAAAEAGVIEEMSFLSSERERQGQIGEAKEIWRRAAEEGAPAAQSGLAEVLSRNGESEAAEEWWRKAVGLRHAPAMLALAEVLDARGLRREAEDLWRNATDAGDWLALRRLSRLLEESGWASEAVEIWRPRAVLNDLEAICELARLLEVTGELEASEKWWRRGIDAGAFKAVFGLEALLRRNGNAEDAYRVVERAIAAGDADVIEKMCRWTGDITMIKGVESGLRRACDAGDERAQEQLAAFLEASNRTDEAVALWLPAAEAGDCAAMHRVARLMYVTKKFRDAERWQSRLVEADDGRAMAQRAQTLLESGQLQEAERLERRALETGYTPNPPINLEYLLRTTGRVSEADQLHAYGIEPGGRTADPW